MITDDNTPASPSPQPSAALAGAAPAAGHYGAAGSNMRSRLKRRFPKSAAHTQPTLVGVLTPEVAPVPASEGGAPAAAVGNQPPSHGRDAQRRQPREQRHEHSGRSDRSGRPRQPREQGPSGQQGQPGRGMRPGSRPGQSAQRDAAAAPRANPNNASGQAALASHATRRPNREGGFERQRSGRPADFAPRPQRPQRAEGLPVPAAPRLAGSFSTTPHGHDSLWKKVRSWWTGFWTEEAKGGPTASQQGQGAPALGRQGGGGDGRSGTPRRPAGTPSFQGRQGRTERRPDQRRSQGAPRGQDQRSGRRPQAHRAPGQPAAQPSGPGDQAQ